MSWLYSIVFAGLLLSSDGEGLVKSPDFTYPEFPVAGIVLSDEIEKFEQTYPLNANGRVNVSNVNGSIVIEAWDRKEVRLEATKIADSKEPLAEVEIKVDASPDFISIEADYDNWKNRGHREDWNSGRKIEVQFRLNVPRTAVLDKVGTVNGSVNVSNMTNISKISAVNGHVKAVNLRGTAKLETVNGTVDADFDRLETGSRINLSTVNGRVNLVIPSDANATIKADSLNGSITNDFGLPVRKGQYVGRDMHGRVGTGDVQIRLNSVNGGLSVSRKNDGRTPNPATNLLTPKNKSGDDDWDDDTDNASNYDNEKLNKDIAQAVKDSAKHADKGLKEARKHVNKIKPELAKITSASLADAADAIQETGKVLNSEEFKQQIKEAQASQNQALIRMSEAFWVAGVPSIVKKSNSFDVKGTPKVTIEAKGCGVKVRGWDKAEVKYVVTEIAGQRKSPVSVIEDQTASGVSLKVVNGGAAGDDWKLFNRVNQVRIEVFVPKKSDLKIITDGEIRLDGVSGNIEVIGGDEAINIRDADGTLRLTAVDGQVRIIGFKGEVDSKTVDGDVYLEGEFSRISGEAVDGSYVLTLAETADADIETMGSGFSVEDLPNNKKLSERKWRFGKGGPKYRFSSAGGMVVIRNSDLLESDL